MGVCVSIFNYVNCIYDSTFILLVPINNELFYYLENMSKMEDISQALCSLNNNDTERHLIVITFDHPNHGGGLVHKLGNQDWGKNGEQNPFHAQDMWNMYNESSNTISILIDVVEDYLFGPTQQSRVQVWGVMGFSMGGHSTFVAAANGKLIIMAKKRAKIDEKRAREN